jgi:hypothetical protein
MAKGHGFWHTLAGPYGAGWAGAMDLEREMDAAREQWLLEQLVIRWGDATKRSPPREELLHFYMSRVGNRDAWRYLDSRIEATRRLLRKRLRDNPSAPPTPEPKPHSKGGREANVTPVVEQKMRAMPPEKLAAMKNEEMASVFGASITTVRAARNEVLVHRFHETDLL